MEKIDFNINFSGFEANEKILVDTGVILALANEYDAWHNTVSNLFNTHVLNDDEDKPLFLFVNPTILNEITFLANRPFENYKSKFPSQDLSGVDPNTVLSSTINDVKILVDEEILLIIDGNKNSALKQLEIYKELGSADAVNASIANEYGLNFLTVDTKLANNIYRYRENLSNIPKIYYTIPMFRTY